MPLAEAGRVFTLLTIGDGLVAQIPALLSSTAAPHRDPMSRASTLSEQVVKQLVQHPRALTVAGGILGIIGLLTGMPNVMFLLLAAATTARATGSRSAPRPRRPRRRTRMPRPKPGAPAAEREPAGKTSVPST